MNKIEYLILTSNFIFLRISKQSDQANSVELFGDFVDKNALNDLNTEKAVIDFARKVSGVLVKEGRKKHIQEFVKEILGSVSTVLTSLEYDVRCE